MGGKQGLDFGELCKLRKGVGFYPKYHGCLGDRVHKLDKNDSGLSSLDSMWSSGQYETGRKGAGHNP